MYKEINFCGIYLPPFFLGLLITGLIFLPLHRHWDRTGLQNRVWNRPVFETAVFIILLVAVNFIL